MSRQLFIVSAYIIDSNGTFNQLTDYPKTFDSKNYADDIDKARRRAEGDFSEVWSTMCKRDDRQIQTVTLQTIDGFQLDRKTNGQFVESIPTSN